MSEGARNFRPAARLTEEMTPPSTSSEAGSRLVGPAALLLLLGLACSPASSGPGDAGEPPDGGTQQDAGVPSDAGVVIPSCLEVDAGPATRLSVRGSSLLDEHGQPVVLRGWNWGEWGSATEQDALDNAAQGATAVRLPLRWWGDYPAGMDAYDPSGPPYLDAARLCELDRTVSWAVRHGLWVILFVDSNCGQGSRERDTVAACGAADGGAPANFSNDPQMKQRFAEAWAFLAARYRQVPRMGMYELLPEPNFTCGAHDACPDWSLFPAFYASLLPSIRASEPGIPVMVGAGAGYDLQHIDTAYIEGATSIVYTGDLFLQAASDPQWLAALTQFRSSHDAPVFVQQVGIRKSTPDAGVLVDGLLEQLDGADIGWTWWTYREPNAPQGQGYAPYYKGASTPWTLDEPWLQRITRHF
jgi:hypothetical protein